MIDFSYEREREEKISKMIWKHDGTIFAKFNDDDEAIISAPNWVRRFSINAWNIAISVKAYWIAAYIGAGVVHIMNQHYLSLFAFRLELLSLKMMCRRRSHVLPLDSTPKTRCIYCSIFHLSLYLDFISSNTFRYISTLTYEQYA